MEVCAKEGELHGESGVWSVAQRQKESYGHDADAEFK